MTDITLALEKIGAEKLARGNLIRNDDELEPYWELVKKIAKAFKIIKEKRVACDLLTNPEVKDYKQYNSHCDKYDFIVPLTEEEFNLLKGVLSSSTLELGHESIK